MKKTFWNRTAKIYDRFMRKDHKAYKQMYSLIYPVVRHKQVLELATGTGLISKHIIRSADHIEATDASPEMVEQAKQGVQSTKLHFSVQDMFHLPYADQSFDVVIVSNALHIVPEPEKALAEIRRVLKDDGVLIAPTFTHGDNGFRGKTKAFLMKLVGFRQYSKWSSESYLDFLQKQGWTVQKCEVLKASFSLTYADTILFMLRNLKQPSTPSLICAMSDRRKDPNRNRLRWIWPALWSSYKSRRSWRRHSLH